MSSIETAPVGPGPLTRVLLNGDRVAADVAEAITDATLTRTIDGVTFFELTVHDPSRTLLRSELFRQRSVVNVDGARFELAQVRKMGNQFGMTFEDAIVAALRRRKEPRTAAAGSTTRSAFVRRLVDEVYGTVVGPDSPQALLDGFATDGTDPAAAAAVTSIPIIGSVVAAAAGAPGGIAAVPGVGNVLAVVGGAAGSTAIDDLAASWRNDTFTKHYLTAQQVAQVAAGAGFSGDNLVTAVAVALAESSGDPNVVSKPNTDGTIDRGLWQVNSVHSQYDHDQLLVPSYNAAAAFEISGSGTNFRPWTTFRLPPFAYKAHLDEATAGVAALTAVTTAAAPHAAVVQDTPMVATGADRKTSEPKDWWTSIKALADEVQWRVFCDLGVIWFAPDPWLIGQPPYFEISEGSPGVDWLDFDFDIGKPRSTMDLQAHASRWAVPPGVPVVVTDMGVGSGRWLVSKITRSLFSSSVNVELTQPQPQLPEPRHQAPATSGPAAGASTASGSTLNKGWGGGTIPTDMRDRIRGMVRFALDQLGDEYYWAGNGPDAWDCSGLVHAAAAAVDAFVARQTTQALKQCTDAGTMIDIQDGINTFGALLWIVPPTGDHIAISLGDGQTIEAMGTKWGVVNGRANRFSVAALVPDLKDGYDLGGGPDDKSGTGGGFSDEIGGGGGGGGGGGSGW